MNVHVVDTTVANDAKRFERLASLQESDIVIRFGAMCNGNQQIISEITSKVGLGQIDKLIFYGHAAPGIMGATTGRNLNGVLDNSGFGAFCRPGYPCDSNQWEALRPRFAAHGIVVLKGCNVAQGALGHELLRQLSQAFDVPVYGSDWYQATGVSYLVGNVSKAMPDGTIVEDKVNEGGGFWKLVRDDPFAAFSVGTFEFLADPDSN